MSIPEPVFPMTLAAFRKLPQRPGLFAQEAGENQMNRFEKLVQELYRGAGTILVVNSHDELEALFKRIAWSAWATAAAEKVL